MEHAKKILQKSLILTSALLNIKALLSFKNSFTMLLTISFQQCILPLAETLVSDVPCRYNKK